MLSTPQWASWLALARIELRAPLPGVGMVASGANAFVHVRAGVEFLAMFFPHPTEVGEPFYAIVARRPDSSLQTFVFERTLPMAALPMRAVQVEYALEHRVLVRKEHCVLPTPSIETCLRKAAAVASATIPTASVPRNTSTVRPAPTGVLSQ